MSFSGIFMGLLVDRYNRKWLLVICSFVWSTCTFCTGYFKPFWALLLARFFLGVFESVCNPAAYSLIRDYFPPSHRARANAIYSSGIYVGSAISSISIVLINAFTWRGSFMVTGTIGMVFSVLALFVLREPPRPSPPAPKKTEEKEETEPLFNTPKSPEPPKKPGCGDFIRGFGKATKELISNPTSRYCLIGSALRFFGGYSLAFYLPIYFQHIYTSYDKQFGVLNAVMASILAFLSALSGGILSDMYHSKTYMAKSYICILSSVLAAPPMALCCIIQDKFYLSISMLGLNYLFAEAWGSPAITMLQDSVDPSMIGFCISAFMFFNTMAGMFATFALGEIQQWMDAENNLSVYGNTLFLFLMISYIGCCPFYYLAGLHYSKFMDAIAFEKDLMEKAEEEGLDTIHEGDSMDEVESVQ